MPNRVAILTGISKGIGKQTALLLAQSGVSIVGNYRADDKNAELVRDEIHRLGAECTLVRGDIGEECVVKRLVSEAIRKHGIVSYLVNNASHYERLTFDQITSSRFIEMLKVNVVAAFLLIKEIAPLMIERRYGNIVNVSSANATRGYPYSCHYNSAKAGIQGLTTSLAQELAPFIRVNCVAPGFIETSMIAKDTKSRRRNRLSSVPLGTIGEPIDVASLVCFLLRDEAKYITGQTIRVSGGY